MGKILKNSILENVPFWVFAGVSMAMGIASFLAPPPWEIESSVLKFISWMFAFAALWTFFVAMKRGLDARLQHGNTSVTVGNLENSGVDTTGSDDEETVY